MSRRWIVAFVGLAFVLGVTAGTALAKKKKSIDPATYAGKSAEDAASSLLELAEGLAADGSYENIYTGRVYYLSGRADEAQALFDKAMSSSGTAGDMIRLGRVYYQGGDWDRARELFDRVLAKEPKDEDWLAEIGAYYNLQGDREHAEELFGRCFDQGTALKNVLAVAGSYVGVSPLRRP